MASTEARPGRLFFALWPDPATRDALRAVQGRLPDKGARPLHPQDLHLTLAFLGDISPSMLACAHTAADRVQAAAPTLRLSRLGSWPGPRVSWLAPDPADPCPALDRLVAQLWQGLSGCGLTPEDRPYRPHVTLQRKSAPLSSQILEAPIRWQPDAFVLAGSTGAAAGPRYRILQRWPLSAAGSAASEKID